MSSVADDLIGAALDWPRQKADFVWDHGALVDIYIADTTKTDWTSSLGLIFDGRHDARLFRGEKLLVSTPPAIDELLAPADGVKLVLGFQVGGVELRCYFFGPDEIEFSFEPSTVNETALKALLQFVLDLGDATQKRVIMTPESASHRESAAVPIFRYEPAKPQLTWIGPPQTRSLADRF